jgi:hypothetical protein
MEESEFMALVETVIERLSEKTAEGAYQPDWISKEEALKTLNIRSKTTLAKLRDEGDIVFTRPKPKLILYSRSSILSYLEKHTQKF